MRERDAGAALWLDFIPPPQTHPREHTHTHTPNSLHLKLIVTFVNEISVYGGSNSQQREKIDRHKIQIAMFEFEYNLNLE